VQRLSRQKIGVPIVMLRPNLEANFGGSLTKTASFIITGNGDVVQARARTLVAMGQGKYAQAAPLLYLN